MRTLRFLLVCLGSLALGVVACGSSLQEAASAAAAISPRLETTALHAVPATSADLPPSDRLPAIGDVRRVGDAEVNDPTGGSPSLRVSARPLVPASRQASSAGQTALRDAPTCAALCVFLC